ncbi:hypothetical protein [Enhygromyxa salina]|uniref:Uncharacterized protein n=1 Tax=Enhygromyxa salina TaxID=215803 RepID=A0A2S9YMN1_9BACT|nr:hypothetical protein [Enhygromyxa salina]PRQ06349.1 hypothetical protein ENSA7_38950 [Enhygromyxa salina]
MGLEHSVRAGGPAGFVGLFAALGLGGCEARDSCEGLRTFDSPPEPTASDTAPPTVLDGDWIGAGVLELQFSKPLSVGAAPDPTRFALLGWGAQVQSYGSSCYVQTRYSALAVGYYRSSVADVWVAPEDPSLLRLRMSNTAAACRTVADIVAEGVLLVYADAQFEGAGPKLLDAEGDAVPDLGPQWAIPRWESCIDDDGYYGGYYCGYALNQTAVGHLPALNVLAPIPCPS